MLSFHQSRLWKRFERGEVSLHTLLYTRFVRTFERMGIDIDGVIFEDDYQDNLGRGFLVGRRGICLPQAFSKPRSLYHYQRRCENAASPLGRHFSGNHGERCFYFRGNGSAKAAKRVFRDRNVSLIPQFDPCSALVIGDSLISDIQGGREWGLDTCWYNRIANGMIVVLLQPMKLLFARIV